MIVSGPLYSQNSRVCRFVITCAFRKSTKIELPQHQFTGGPAGRLPHNERARRKYGENARGWQIARIGLRSLNPGLLIACDADDRAALQHMDIPALLIYGAPATSTTRPPSITSATASPKRSNISTRIAIVRRTSGNASAFLATYSILSALLELLGEYRSEICPLGAYRKSTARLPGFRANVLWV
jgi:hypothetical protein